MVKSLEKLVRSALVALSISIGSLGLAKGLEARTLHVPSE